eukprot:2147966-Pyramimonas_sp.AAC.1
MQIFVGVITCARLWRWCCWVMCLRREVWVEKRAPHSSPSSVRTSHTKAPSSSTPSVVTAASSAQGPAGKAPTVTSAGGGICTVFSAARNLPKSKGLNSEDRSTSAKIVKILKDLIQAARAHDRGRNPQVRFHLANPRRSRYRRSPPHELRCSRLVLSPQGPEECTQRLNVRRR